MIGHVYTVQIVYTGQSPGARLYRLCTLVRALPSHTTTVLSLSVVEARLSPRKLLDLSLFTTGLYIGYAND